MLYQLTRIPSFTNTGNMCCFHKILQRSCRIYLDGTDDFSAYKKNLCCAISRLESRKNSIKTEASSSLAYYHIRSKQARRGALNARC